MQTELMDQSYRCVDLDASAWNKIDELMWSANVFFSPFFHFFVFIWHGIFVLRLPTMMNNVVRITFISCIPLKCWKCINCLDSNYLVYYLPMHPKANRLKKFHLHSCLGVRECVWGDDPNWRDSSESVAVRLLS